MNIRALYIKFMRQKEGFEPPKALLFVNIMAICDLASIFASFTMIKIRVHYIYIDNSPSKPPFIFPKYFYIPIFAFFSIQV